MTWKAVLENVSETAVPNDTVDINITFSDGKKKFTKFYNLHASNFKSLEDVRALIQGELTSLEKFHETYDVLKPLVGKDIMTGEEASLLEIKSQ